MTFTIDLNNLAAFPGETTPPKAKKRIVKFDPKELASPVAGKLEQTAESWMQKIARHIGAKPVREASKLLLPV
jgi:hypothetical protein